MNRKEDWDWKKIEKMEVCDATRSNSSDRIGTLVEHVICKEKFLTTMVRNVHIESKAEDLRYIIERVGSACSPKLLQSVSHQLNILKPCNGGEYVRKLLEACSRICFQQTKNPKAISFFEEALKNFEGFDDAQTGHVAAEMLYPDESSLDARINLAKEFMKENSFDAAVKKFKDEAIKKVGSSWLVKFHEVRDKYGYKITDKELN